MTLQIQLRMIDGDRLVILTDEQQRKMLNALLAAARLYLSDRREFSGSKDLADMSKSERDIYDSYTARIDSVLNLLDVFGAEIYQ